MSLLENSMNLAHESRFLNGLPLVCAHLLPEIPTKSQSTLAKQVKQNVR